MRRSMDDRSASTEVSFVPGPLTLRVPARPEALSIVRIVVMSCGAAAGLSVQDIFSFSQDAVEAFTDAHMHDPDATSVVVRPQVGIQNVDLRPVRANG